MKNVVLCADDYSQNRPINRAILDLAAGNRLGAISCLTQSPTWGSDARDLLSASTGQQLGLHFNLTLPYGSAERSVGSLMLAALARSIGTDWVRKCFKRQWEDFVRRVGRNPDFVDGHQHVHTFPVVRDVVVEEVGDRDPNCWIRSLEPPPDLSSGSIKQAILKRFSRSLIALLRSEGLRTNSQFCGFRPYRPSFDFESAFKEWLYFCKDGDMIMCHPGSGDEDRSDPIRNSRRGEFAYLSSRRLDADLQKYRVALNPRGHPH